MLHIPLIDNTLEIVGGIFLLYQLAHRYFHKKFCRKYFRRKGKRSSSGRIEMTRLK